MKSIIVQSENSPFVDSVTESKLTSRFLCAKESWNTAGAKRKCPNEKRHSPGKCKNCRKDILNLTNDDKTHRLAKRGSY